MNKEYSTLPNSRRQFIKQIGKTVAYASSAFWLPNAIAKSDIIKPINTLLPFRKDASQLLLHFNENSLGMSQTAMLAAQNAIKDKGNRYADASIDILRNELSKKNSIDSTQFILGNGSTEIIGAVIEYAASMNATMIEPNPTFGDARSRAKARGMNVIQVELGKDFVTDIEQLQQAAKGIKGNLLINICNPNNPTGSITSTKELKNWIKSAPPTYFFLIDEAYHEYAETNLNYESMVSLVKEGVENIVVTRTFSKLYGMAGMRIGYGLASPKTASKLERFAASFNLSIAGVTAAIESLKDEEFYKISLSSNSNAKAMLTQTLIELELPYIESNTNFVLHRIRGDLQTYQLRMLNNNIKVGRRMTKEDSWCRLSIGTPHEMEIFAKTLIAFRERGWV